MHPYNKYIFKFIHHCKKTSSYAFKFNFNVLHFFISTPTLTQSTIMAYKQMRWRVGTQKKRNRCWNMHKIHMSHMSDSNVKLRMELDWKMCSVFVFLFQPLWCGHYLTYEIFFCVFFFQIWFLLFQSWFFCRFLNFLLVLFVAITGMWERACVFLCFELNVNIRFIFFYLKKLQINPSFTYTCTSVPWICVLAIQIQRVIILSPPPV